MIGRQLHPNECLDAMSVAGKEIMGNIPSNVRLEVALDGPISADSAKAAVAEIFENLQKADFKAK